MLMSAASAATAVRGSKVVASSAASKYLKNRENEYGTNTIGVGGQDV